MNSSSIRISWQWTSSGPAPDCFSATSVTYRPEGGGESSQQLSDPAANETTLTDLQCNTNYTITVMATAGEHRREGIASILLQGITFLCICLSLHTVLQSKRANFVVFKIFCYFQESVQEGSTLSLWEDTTSTYTASLEVTCCHVI